MAFIPNGEGVPRILHPDIFDKYAETPLIGPRFAATKEVVAKTAQEVARRALELETIDPPMSVVIRNGDINGVRRTLQDLHDQDYDGPLDVVVVGNKPASDPNVSQLLSDEPVKYVHVPQSPTETDPGFSYPRSLNDGLAATDSSTPRVLFLTNNRLGTNQSLKAITVAHAEYPDEKVGIVTGQSLPTVGYATDKRTGGLIAQNPTLGDYFISTTRGELSRIRKPMQVHREPGAGIGIGNRSAFERDGLQAIGGFPPQFGSGSEDKFAARELLEGFTTKNTTYDYETKRYSAPPEVIERRVAVVTPGLLSLHSKGNPLIPSAKHAWDMFTLREEDPQPFDHGKIAKMRPDITGQQ